MKMRKCSMCKRLYRPNSAHQKSCSKECMIAHRNKYGRLYYRNNTAKHRKAMKNWQQNNRDKVRKNNQKWRLENKEYFKFYRENVYPQTALKSICNKYQFSNKLFNALNKGGKTADEELKRLGIKMKEGKK